MDLSKLKIGKFTKVTTINFPKGIEFGLESSRTPEVIIYFIAEPADVERFVETCRKAALPEDNRVIMVYRKGVKSLNRDIIITPFRDGAYADFKLKAPMLCSLSDSLSAFVMRRT